MLCLSLSLLTSTGNCAIRNVPIPQCPLKHLQMYSAPICHSWECGGVSSYVSTSADGTTPPLRGVSAPPEVTLYSPYYRFYIFSVMDNDDVVALFSLLSQPGSCINCSFSCIIVMCWFASHRSVTYTGKFNTRSEFTEIPF